ncbi:MAG: thiamine pyrophosphate-dependent dehydrogenase E1 component subunit alpha [Proteobacteria bacterium]|nr:thiamine pyrophosphate-dependent dehydrogenase E1 component subunit alpha [Pseudomonadota bacterium]
MSGSASTSHLLAQFAAMAQIRGFEEVVGEARRSGRLSGLLHLSIGGEAVAVGVISQLNSDDRVYSTHRAHGHFLAAGSDPDALMAELAGRETGLCRGRGGSMHLMDTQAVLATGVVGGSIPIAVGHAMALPNDAIAVAFFGDGAVQTGIFSEALNIAALYEARVLFVCENNGMVEFTTREEHTRVEDVVSYAQLHKLIHQQVDGADVEAVERATADLLAQIRAGSGPAMLECRFTRIRPHYEGDMRGANAKGRDPLDITAERLLKLGIDPDEIDNRRREMRVAAEQTLARALEAPVPREEEDKNLVFAKVL